MPYDIGDQLRHTELGRVGQLRQLPLVSDQGGDCVEVAEAPCTTVAIRDSKTPAGPILTLAPAVFTTFVNWTSTTAE
ncbi:DUF397 domain-containing protein [Streptomyces sp. NPDC048420]|uniref:DUF397 domain-containing protein n=1 Tax=Streptomyces sp. NPDC048420 TaxID=3155755 RepID=UPI00342A5560